MRNFMAISLFLFFLGCGFMPSCFAQDTGAPNVEFARPQDREALDYLGLEGHSETFTLAQVKADVVVVEVFSWDCHFCQRQAPRMAQLYHLLEKKGLSDRVKIIGIGATNTDLELREYKNLFHIPFPLVADPDYKSYGFAGTLDIPCVIVFARNAQGVFRSVYSRSREQRGADMMLKDILSATGL